MSKRIKVNQVECLECGHVYNSNEYPSSCPNCDEMKELYNDLFGPDDMDEMDKLNNYPEL